MPEFPSKVGMEIHEAQEGEEHGLTSRSSADMLLHPDNAEGLPAIEARGGGGLLGAILGGVASAIKKHLASPKVKDPGGHPLGPGGQPQAPDPPTAPPQTVTRQQTKTVVVPTGPGPVSVPTKSTTSSISSTPHPDSISGTSSTLATSTSNSLSKTSDQHDHESTPIPQLSTGTPTLTLSSGASSSSTNPQQEITALPPAPQGGIEANHRQSLAVEIGIGIGIFFALLLLTLAIFLILRKVKRKREKLFRKEFYDKRSSFDKESRFSGSELTSDLDFPTTIEGSGSQGRSRYRDSQTTTYSLPRRVWDVLSITNLSSASYSQDMHGHSNPSRSRRPSFSTMRS